MSMSGINANRIEMKLSFLKLPLVLVVAPLFLLAWAMICVGENKETNQAPPDTITIERSR